MNTKTRINASKQVIHKEAEATGEFIENEIADAEVSRTTIKL